jgi:hypothetical protein
LHIHFIGQIVKSLRTILVLAALFGASACGSALAHSGGGMGGFHGSAGHFSGGHVGGFHGHEGFHGREFHGDRFRPHARIGVFAGGFALAPFAYAPFYADPYSPPVYIEQNPAPDAAQQQSVNPWYFCSGSNAYYPYVTECPEGWQQVTPN